MNFCDLIDWEIEEIAKEFPRGFAVAPTGKVYRVVYAASDILSIVESFPLPPRNGGYYVVREVED